MPTQNRPASKEQAPDPATSYERAKPEKESESGQLDAPEIDFADQRDHLHQAGQKRRPSEQINAHQDVNKRKNSDPKP